MFKKLLVILLALALVMSSSMVVMAGENDKAADAADESVEVAVDGEKAEGEEAKVESAESETDGRFLGINFDVEIGEILEGLLSSVTDESGSFDTGKIETLITSLFAAEDEEYDVEVDEEKMESFEDVEAAISQHLLEETADGMEVGDETVFSYVIADKDTHEDGTMHLFGYFTIMNYDVDEECPDDLVMKNGAGLTELLTLELNEDGVYEVTEYVTAEDGEGYADSVAQMCEAMDMDPDDFYEELAIKDLTFVSDLYGFMDEHPEYDHIEYMGELVTKDDLDATVDELFDTYLALYAIDGVLTEEDAETTEGENAEGESAEGESAEGESAEVAVDGESAEGESAEGESAEGESAEGESAEGESAEGESAEGESAEGESAEGESADVAVDGESVEGESAEGESAEGESAEGESAEGETAETGLVDTHELLDTIITSIVEAVTDVDLSAKEEVTGNEYSEDGTVLSLLKDVLTAITNGRNEAGKENDESMVGALDALSSLGEEDETSEEELDELLNVMLLTLIDKKVDTELEEGSKPSDLARANDLAQYVYDTAKANEMIVEAVEATDSNLFELIESCNAVLEPYANEDGTLNVVPDIPEDPFDEFEVEIAKVADYINTMDGNKQAALDLLNLVHEIEDEIHFIVHGHTNEELAEAE